MAQPHAVVVGAGVGGLAAAAALARTGCAVTVFEKAPVLDPVAAGLALAPNALRALDALDAGEEVRKRSAPHGIAAIRSRNGRWLLRTGPHETQVRYGDAVSVLRYADLVDVLLQRLPPGALRTGSAVTAVEPGTTRQPARVATETGDVAADLVVLADGARSALRGELFLEHPGAVYAGFACWRAVVPWRPEDPLDFGETWGRGGTAGVLPLSGDEVYCYVTGNVPAGERAADERAEAVSRVEDWHEPLADLFAAARPEAVVRSDVWHVDTPLPAYHKGRVALVGDTAHAMTPNLAQGACQAIEDAVVLAHHASGSMAYVPTAVQSYTASRLPRTAALVQRSAQLAEAVQNDSPVLTGLRDTAAGLVGKVAPWQLARYTRPVDDWRPPGEPRTADR
ncbi:FAD-dependent monooxygenase [Nocardiopsis sp. RSe5-2]|uniref:FAD-dependent monooxygenase n=1 Tax=Nocardiopsis endophytica TaxID=3018445 RepID=A0ABT4UDC1_9ACTN|nr:FAD-dependent monooxygenase [Nocardiopsis endophytica]MDA2814961.1 FAD-dependent monooxygenase [Nocardiopsis endophytica]